MPRRSELLEKERNYRLVSREKPEKGKWIKDFAGFLFSSVGIVVLGIFTAVLGAEAYIKLERPSEELRYEAKQHIAKKVDSAAYYLGDTFWNYVHDEDRYNFTYDGFVNQTEVDLRTFVQYVVNATRDFNYDGAVQGWEYDWTFPKALLFTITIMALIGYGHIAPKTLTGKMFTIIYSLFAIAVFLMFLAKVGSALAHGLEWVYSRLCCRCFRSQRLKSEIPSRKMQRKLRRRLVDEQVGEEVFMPTSSIPIPIIVSVMVLLMYIFLGSVFFHSWEGWDFVSAAYFSFITLTTIGFGDFSPTESFNGIVDPNAGLVDYFKMIFTIVYCSIGLAVISLCISLIQEQVGRSAAIALGIKGEVIEMDEVEIVGRIPNFLESDQTGQEEDVAERVTVPVATGVVEPTIPGEAKVDDDEENENEDEEESDEDEEDSEEEEDSDANEENDNEESESDEDENESDENAE